MGDQLESGPSLQELFEIPPRGPRKKPKIKTVKTESRSSRNQVSIAATIADNAD